MGLEKVEEMIELQLEELNNRTPDNYNIFRRQL